LKLILRLAYLWFLGIPLGALWMAFAWLACLTIVGMPVGVWMLNRVPLIMTLESDEHLRPVEVKGKIHYVFEEMEQPSFLVRALWFLLVGWWLGALWIKLSLLLAATFLGLPIAFWMINRVPFVMTLRR